MKFLGRAFVGLFLTSVAVALLALALNSVREAVVEQMNKEPRQRLQREQVFAVNIVEFIPNAISPTITTFGTIQSGRTLELRINRGGPITFVADEFIEGGIVSQGQILIQTDDSDENTALNRAEIERDVAQADVEAAEQTVHFAKRDVEGTQQQAGLQAQALTRQKNLVAKGVGTEAAIENAELSVVVASQSVLAKERAFGQAVSARTQAQNRLRLAGLVLQEAERALADTRLTAEFSGVLSGISAVSGGLVNANEQVGSLIDPQRLEVDFQVSNAQYARLLDSSGKLNGAQVTLIMSLQDFKVEATGTINRESAVVEAGKTGRRLFARINSGDARKFRSGDFVTVNVSEPELPGVAVLPGSAVDGANTVLVLGDDNRLVLEPVQVLRRQGNDVLVRSRDLAGLNIVAERTPLLGAGILVSPIGVAVTADDNAQEPQEIELSDDRRQQLIAAVEENKRMPADVKARLLESLQKPKVPVAMIERLESRMNGGGRDG